MDSLHRLDDRLFFAIHSVAAHSGWLHVPAELYANYGVAVFAGLLLVALLRARGRSSRDLAATGWAGLATLVALAANQPLVNAVHERRPYVTHPHLVVLVHRSSDFSFPSDHAVMAGAITAGLLIAWRRLGAVAAVFALLMAIVRVYVAAHYPWDVVAGLLVGAAVAALGWPLLRGPLTMMASRLRRVPPFHSLFAPGGATMSASSGPGSVT